MRPAGADDASARCRRPRRRLPGGDRAPRTRWTAERTARLTATRDSTSVRVFIRAQLRHSRAPGVPADRHQTDLVSGVAAPVRDVLGWRPGTADLARADASQDFGGTAHTHGENTDSTHSPSTRKGEQ